MSADDPDIDQLTRDALAALATATDRDALRRARHEHAGDRSPLALAARQIATLPPARRRDAGDRVAAARRRVEEAAVSRWLVL